MGADGYILDPDIPLDITVRCYGCGHPIPTFGHKLGPVQHFPACELKNERPLPVTIDFGLNYDSR